METILKPVAKACMLTGEVFVCGQTVVSILLHHPDTGYQRLDCTEAAARAYQPEGREVCRWRIRFAAPDTSAHELRKAARQTAEDLFKDLHEKHRVASLQADEALLLNLLATHLERQKVLRGIAAGTPQFLHIREKKTYHLPSCEWDPLALASMLNQLGPLVKG